MKNRFLFVLTALCLLLQFTHIIYADTFVLRDGNKIVGKIIKETDTHYIVSTKDLGEITIEKERIHELLRDEEKVKTFSRISFENLVDKLILSYKSSEISKTNPVFAIIPFQVDDPLLQEQKIGFGISEVLTDIFVKRWIKDILVIERNKLEEVLSEQKLSMTGIINENTAIKTGRLLNADLLLLGSVSKIDNNYYINARLIKTDSGQIISAESITHSVKKVKKEAKSYIDLPDNWGVYYGFKSITRSAESWQETNGQNVTYTNSEYTNESIAFFIIAIRHFLSKNILAELQFAPNPINSTEHYVESSNGEKREFPLYGGSPSALTLTWVQKFGRFYTMLGGGINSCNASTGEGYNNMMLPSIRAGIEWRFKKRVGIDIIADYMSGNTEVTGKVDDQALEKPLYKINPLALVISISFYF